MGLDSVELVLAIEETFGIDLPDGEVSRVETVGDLHALVLHKLGMRETEAGASEVWERLKQVVVDEIGVEPNEVVPAARIVADLGID